MTRYQILTAETEPGREALAAVMARSYRADLAAVPPAWARALLAGGPDADPVEGEIREPAPAYGVVIVDRRQAEAVADKADARIANEADKRARFEAGELGLDIYGMRERLAEKGLRYVEYVELDLPPEVPFAAVVEIVERVVHQPIRQKMPRTRRGRTFGRILTIDGNSGASFAM